MANKFKELWKSQYMRKNLTNSQKQMLVDKLLDELEDNLDDLQWQSKVKAWLRSKNVDEADMKDIIREVSEELMLN